MVNPGSASICASSMCNVPSMSSETKARLVRPLVLVTLPAPPPQPLSPSTVKNEIKATARFQAVGMLIEDVVGFVKFAIITKQQGCPTLGFFCQGWGTRHDCL